MSILTTFYLYIAQLTIHWKILKIHRTGRCYRQSKKGSSVIKVKKKTLKTVMKHWKYKYAGLICFE